MDSSAQINRSLTRVSKLTGKRVLINYIFIAKNGTFDHVEQKHGVITSVGLDEVTVLEHSTTHRLSLPADFSAFKEAPKGTYQLSTTGEIVRNPDYTTEWIAPVDKPLTAANLLARRICSAYSLYGIGTALYGHADTRPDGSYVTTKWYTFFMLPILPIASFRMYGSKAASALGDAAPGPRWSVPERLNKTQVSSTYSKTYTTLFFVVLVLYGLNLVMPAN
jgi:hypothetical protein